MKQEIDKIKQELLKKQIRESSSINNNQQQ